MTQYYLVDTCIWRDLHEDRKDNLRPLGEWAFQFFLNVVKNRDMIVYSEMIIEELSKEFSNEEIVKIFRIVAEEGLLKKAEISKEQAEEAARLCRQLKLPFGDVFHAIIARDNDAIIVTRDKHFEQLTFMVDVKKPEELF